MIVALFRRFFRRGNERETVILRHYILEKSTSQESRHYVEFPRVTVEAFVPMSTLDSVASGHHLTVLLSGSHPGYEEHVGIHGRRKIQKVRRLLESHGLHPIVTKDRSWEERCQDNRRALALFHAALRKQGLPPISGISSR